MDSVVESGADFTPLTRFSIPRTLRGQYGGHRAVLDSQKWFSTLRCGIGITNADHQYPSFLSVGTIGFFLRDDGGNDDLVSNNHVIGGSNDARQGDPIVQPARWTSRRSSCSTWPPPAT